MVLTHYSGEVGGATQKIRVRQIRPTDPTPISGDMYFDEVNSKLYIFDGIRWWVTVTGGSDLTSTSTTSSSTSTTSSSTSTTSSSTSTTSRSTSTTSISTTSSSISTTSSSISTTSSSISTSTTSSSSTSTT